jgi:four helix bundle protein
MTTSSSSYSYSAVRKPRTRTRTTTRTISASHMFDHEKLDVYQLSLHFLTWVTPLLQEVTQTHGAKVREASDHLDRASLSIVLNTAEGNGKRRKLIRAKFFDDARGSGTECAACLDAFVAKGVATKDQVREGKEILVRVVSMLTKLVQLYEGESTVKEAGAEYQSN